MKVSIKVVCEATVAEYWEVDVPDSTPDEDAADLAFEKVLAGDSVNCYAEEVTDEHDRELVGRID